MQGIAALQPYPIAFFLIWAGLMKLLSRQMRAQAGTSALARLVGQARAIPAFRLIGVAELGLAAALLLPPVSPGEGTAAAALCLGFLAYLAYLAYSAQAAPASSCGCLGAHGQPLNWRSFARAGLLLAMSVTAIWAQPYIWDVRLAVLGLVEVAVLAGLSAELDRFWLRPLRQLLVRLRKPLALPAGREVALEVSLRLLYRSPAYCTASAQLTSDVREVWDEDGLRFVVYAARDRTAVFAVPLSGDEPSAVRVALIQEPALA